MLGTSQAVGHSPALSAQPAHAGHCTQPARHGPLPRSCAAQGLRQVHAHNLRALPKPSGSSSRGVPGQGYLQRDVWQLCTLAEPDVEAPALPRANTAGAASADITGMLQDVNPPKQSQDPAGRRAQRFCQSPITHTIPFYSLRVNQGVWQTSQPLLNSLQTQPTSRPLLKDIDTTHVPEVGGSSTLEENPSHSACRRAQGNQLKVSRLGSGTHRQSRMVTERLLRARNQL